MAQVIFSFLGVCTYFPTFRDYDTSPDAPAHRMLLVNGGPNAIEKIRMGGLSAHTATIQISRQQVIGDLPPGFPVTEVTADYYKITLNDTFGMKIWVEDTIGSYQEFNIANLPGLEEHLSIALPPPNPLVFNEDPTGASVYVDFDSGTISALLLPVMDSAMGITQLVINTSGEDVGVTFKQFGSENEWTVRLRDGITLPGGVTVSNMVAAGLTENPLDFYLQYLAVGSLFPPISDIRLVNEVPTLPPATFSYGMPVNSNSFEDADPGCSNSHYP
jgi:hypothetical protein